MKPVPFLVAGLVIAVLFKSGFWKMTEPDVPPAQEPKVRTDLRGYKAKRHVAMGEGYAYTWVHSFLSSYDWRDALAFPASVDRLESASSCLPPRSAPGEKLAFANVMHGGLETSIFRTTRKMISTNAERLIVEAKRKPIDDAPIINAMNAISGVTMRTDSFKTTDIILTDTAAPLHVVLVSTANQIWNFQTAPGVTVSRVTLIGSGDLGVVNLDPAIPLTVMDGQTLDACNVLIARDPQSHWRFVKNLGRGSRDKGIMADNRARASAFDKWLGQSYKGYKNGSYATALNANHVFIGPPLALDARIPHSTIKGNPVRVSGAEVIEVMDIDDYREKMRTLATAMAQRLSGQTLAQIKKDR